MQLAPLILISCLAPSERFLQPCISMVKFANYQLIAPVKINPEISRSCRFYTTNNICRKNTSHVQHFAVGFIWALLRLCASSLFLWNVPVGQRRRALGPERGGPPFSQSRGRGEGMKNMIYIIAVYCCYLVPSEEHSKAGRHLYEEGIDGRP